MKPEADTAADVFKALLEAIAEPLAERVAEILELRLAALRPAPLAEMVTPSEYARAHSLAVTTVRSRIRDGDLEAVRIGKRQWRVRADAVIRQPGDGRPTSPAAHIDRILRGGR